MKRFVVLISGRGRNLQALIQACDQGLIPGRIALVISNRSDAAGLQFARVAGIPTQVISHLDFPSREAFETALMHGIDAHAPDAVVLAGFMRILTPAFVGAYVGRLLNIHPSLLPRHPGLNTHAAVLANGETEHGATVHFVTDDLDGGPAIVQGTIPVADADTAQTLATRVLEQVEVRIYPLALAWLANREIEYRDGAVWWHGSPLSQPLMR